MRSISDNELDKLFQDAAQRVEPEFDPGDWEKLSKRIDRSDRINLFRRIAIYLSVALLIIVSTWIGVNYFKGQSESGKNSVDNGAEHGVYEGSDNGKTEINSEINSSAQQAGIDTDNGTSTGSSSDEATSPSSTQGDQTSSAGEASSTSENNTIGGGESKDIAGAGAATITPTTADQTSTQSSSKQKGNVQGKSGLSEQNTAASDARKKDQDGSTINKTAGSIEPTYDQQKIQKPKRTVARAKESSDEGSLSASGNSNSNRADKDLSSKSTDQQQASAVTREGKSLLSSTTVQSKKSQSPTKSVPDDAVNSEVKNSSVKNDAGISSQQQRSSTALPIDTNTSDKKQSVAALHDTLAIENAGADVQNNTTLQNDNTTPANNDKRSAADQVTTSANTSSSKSSDQNSNSSVSPADTLTTVAARTKGNSKQSNSAPSDIAANQSGKTNQTIADCDSLSTKPSSLKSKHNVVLNGDAGDLAQESTRPEEGTGIVSTDSSAEKLTSKEKSLQDREYGVSKGDEKNSISANDTTATIDHIRPNTKSSGFDKNDGTGIVNDNKNSAGADRVISKSDSLSGKQSELKSKGIYTTPDKNGKVLTRNENNAGIAEQNSASKSGLASDSLSSQKELTATEKIRNESNAVAVSDSLKSKSLAKSDSVDHAIDNKKAIEDENEKEDKPRESNWYVKLLVSPDFSAIGYTKPGKPGFDIGLTVEYSPAKHWGISTGAIWSKKLYDKNNPGKAYSYGGTSFEADYLDGDCRVLDIPINITYYIVPDARLNFYATVGVSSYIMLKENYVYTVTENNNNYYYYEDYKNENRHWFSMLNLSFGLQYRISPRVQFQAEPFLKAPMSGVGAGKIDLVSAGSFFTLKYKINK